jgi:hypothetical protein
MTSTPRQRKPAFDFARQLREPGFRDWLQRTGYRSELLVVPLAADADWRDAEPLLMGGQGPALLARQNEQEPHGWELRYINEGDPL